MSTKKVIVSLLLVASTVACYSWRTEPLSPDRPITTLTSPVLRLTLFDGRRHEVAHPYIAHDTLRAWNLGAWNFRASETATPLPVIVPVSQIQRVETRHFSPAKTTALAVGVVSVGLGAAFLYFRQLEFCFICSP